MEKHALENACMQITSAVFFFILSPKLFQSSFGLDMTDPVQSSAFITQLVNQLLR
jgi:hypothetical protein